MNSNSSKPCGELCAILEISQVLIGANVGILHDIFRFGIVAQDGPRHTIEPLIVTAHDQFVESRFPGQDPPYEFKIAPGFLLCLIEKCHASHAILQ